MPIRDREAAITVPPRRKEVERHDACLVQSQSIAQRFVRNTSSKPRTRCVAASRRRAKPGVPDWHCSCTRIPTFGTGTRRDFSVFARAPFATGVSGGSRKASSCGTSHGRGDRFFSPPRIITTIKSIACEIPAKREQPLSRLFIPDIRRILIAERHVDSIGCSTIWRILDAAAIKPWRHRSWIWSRDPLFAERAGNVLDLYERRWNGRRLRSDEFVISADEKTSIQARIRIHDSDFRADGRGRRVEHEYERGGAWAYLAALDVHRGKVYGRVEQSNGIEPFHRLVRQVMNREPYKSARRVFWIVDQGSSHRPTTFPDRLRKQFLNARGVSLPVHASWLNQIEIYFSVLQRKALTPNDFPNLAAVRDRLRRFAQRFNARGRPFNWNYTRRDLHDTLERFSDSVLTGDTKRTYRDTG